MYVTFYGYHCIMLQNMYFNPSYDVMYRIVFLQKKTDVSPFKK